MWILSADDTQHSVIRNIGKGAYLISVMTQTYGEDEVATLGVCALFASELDKVNVGLGYLIHGHFTPRLFTPGTFHPGDISPRTTFHPGDFSPQGLFTPVTKRV